jgi:hypothetical protein
VRLTAPRDCFAFMSGHRMRGAAVDAKATLLRVAGSGQKQGLAAERVRSWSFLHSAGLALGDIGTRPARRAPCVNVAALEAPSVATE